MVSSSLTDCNSSLLVSSSSVAERISSFIAWSSSLEAFSSSLAASYCSIVVFSCPFRNWISSSALRVRLARRGHGSGGRDFGLFLEKDEEKPLRLIARANRPHLRATSSALPSTSTETGAIRPPPCFARLGRARCAIRSQAGKHRGDVRGRLAGDELQVTPGAFREMHDLVHLIHHHRRRPVLLEQTQMQFAEEHRASPGRNADRGVSSALA